MLQVVEPHLNGPGGEVPAVFWSAERGEPLALCGQGVAPAAATIERFHELGHELVPGTGRPRRLRARRVRRLAAAPRASSARGGSRTSSSSRSATRSTATRCTSAFARRSQLNEAADRGLARLARPLPAGARGGRAVPQPRARGDVPAHRRGEPRRLARGGDREGAARVLRRLRRGGDRPFLRGGRRAPHRRRHGRVAGDDRAGRHARLPRPHGLQDAALGGRARSGSSSSRCSTASTSPSSRRRSSSTSSPSARSSRSPTAMRSTATREGPARDAALARVQRRAARARRRGGVGGVRARASAGFRRSSQLRGDARVG